MLPLINRYTRFEILDTGMSVGTMIIPVQWGRRFDHKKRAFGFRTSACVVRKTGKPTVGWPVTIPSIPQDVYPSDVFPGDLSG